MKPLVGRTIVSVRTINDVFETDPPNPEFVARIVEVVLDDGTRLCPDGPYAEMRRRYADPDPED